MKVLYINHTEKKSGAAISLGTLLRHLPDNIQQHFLLRPSIEVEQILGVGANPALRVRFLSQFMTTQYASRLPLPQFLWQLVKAPYCAQRVQRLCKRWQIDIVHINETTLLADAWGSAHAGRPVFIHARTACNSNSFERKCLEHIGKMPRVRFLAIDEEVQDSLPEICQQRTFIIHNPIQLSPSPQPSEVRKLREAWGCEDSTLAIGQVSSLHPQKGVWEILHLAEATMSTLPKAKFIMVGDTRPEFGIGPQLQQAVNERRLTHRVVFAGYRTDLATVYAALDIALCLFGSGLGGVGRTAYEAGLCSKPVVATLPDPKKSSTLRDGTSALLFDTEDIVGVRAGLERLADDPGLRARLGASAREFLAPRHDPAQVARRIVRLYEEALS